MPLSVLVLGLALPLPLLVLAMYLVPTARRISYMPVPTHQQKLTSKPPFRVPGASCHPGRALQSPTPQPRNTTAPQSPQQGKSLTLPLSSPEPSVEILHSVFSASSSSLLSAAVHSHERDTPPGYLSLLLVPPPSPRKRISAKHALNLGNLQRAQASAPYSAGITAFGWAAQLPPPWLLTRCTPSSANFLHLLGSMPSEDVKVRLHRSGLSTLPEIQVGESLSGRDACVEEMLAVLGPDGLKMNRAERKRRWAGVVEEVKYWSSHPDTGNGKGVWDEREPDLQEAWRWGRMAELMLQAFG